MIKALLFDLDDTLYEEKQFVMSGFNAVSDYLSKKHDLSRDAVFTVLKTEFEEGLRKKNFDVLLEKLRLNNENVKTLIDVYRTHAPTISLCSDADIVLRKLKNEFKLGLITDGHLLTQKNKISALNINDCFDVVVINDITKNESKINMKPFEDALKKINIMPRETLCIGDNPMKDFVAAKKLGMYTVRIKRENGIYNKIFVDNSADADFLISSLLQVTEIIAGIEKNNKMRDKNERVI